MFNKCRIKCLSPFIFTESCFQKPPHSPKKIGYGGFCSTVKIENFSMGSPSFYPNRFV